jgi:hypothetical protein
MPSFTLHPEIDRARYRADYKRTGRVAVAPFLRDEDAAALRAHLIARDDWARVMNAGERVYELPRRALAEMPDAQRAELDARVAAAAVDGFQYRFETIRVAEAANDRGLSATLLDRFGDFMASDPVVELLRDITGAPIDFADAQATSYAPGDFLTRHDDDVAGKRRHAAYVLGLTPRWRAEWGGLLLFHGSGGDIDHGFVPGFNALRLFGVPAVHSVSAVWPYAPEPRLSVTGWARSRA